MSLGFSVYYLIKPKDSLLRLFSERPTESDCLLDSPQIWERIETSHDRSPPEHRSAWVKVLFLAWLHHEYLTNESGNQRDEFQQRVADLLGPEPFGPEAFDQWWSVERFDDSNTEEQILRLIGIE